jgi:hypothetical protein
MLRNSSSPETSIDIALETDYVPNVLPGDHGVSKSKLEAVYKEFYRGLVLLQGSKPC